VATDPAEPASGGSFPPFEQIDTFPSQIFWLAVTFFVLYVAASRYFLPKLQKAIDDREGAIARDVAEAAALSATADASVKMFEAKIAEAKARARDTAAKAKAEADKEAATQTAKVEAELNARLTAAEARINDTRARAMSNVGAVAEDTAAAIAEKLSGSKPSAASVKAAVSGVLGG
jgi:F-type H+-transporting ATPase subunit b